MCYNLAMFDLHSPFKITTEQKRASEQIVKNYQDGKERQVLLGVTGSGKTFIMANIIAQLNKPALVLAPNKTLAAQLYQEFRGFFPHNRIGYFISYYDYYQPEAYVPQRNMYIAKEVSINPELERLRIDAVRSVLESRDTVIVASVSSIYSIGSPDDFANQMISYRVDQQVSRQRLLNDFVNLGYNRSEELIEIGKFRVRGDLVEIFPTSEENPIRFVLQDDKKLLSLEYFDAITAELLARLPEINIFPVSYFHHGRERLTGIVQAVKNELSAREAYFLQQDKPDFAERLKEKTLFDMEMLEQYGHCAGIENYSLYLTGREPGDPPYTLLDFFKGDFVTIIDESHITVPQLRGMYKGDQSRKQTLVAFGFRLPSAMDNRPLSFAEINERLNKVLYISATPADHEIVDSEYCITELLVRPTGLLDPEIELRNVESPVEDMLEEINREIERGNRVLVTTLTKRMSEKLSDYLASQTIRCTYMHSEIKPLDRIKIIQKLRKGDIDVLVGINLLREGLDLPEVSLVIIMDADREGFLRTETSLIQTFGRASRHEDGRVILYIKEKTDSIIKAISESERRRKFQVSYNHQHQIVPVSIKKGIKDFYDDDYWIKKSEEELEVNFKNKEALNKEIDKLTKEMKSSAQNLDFKGAAVLRDQVKYLKNILLELY